MRIMKTWAVLVCLPILAGCGWGLFRPAPSSPDYTVDQNRALAYGDKIGRLIDAHGTAHQILANLARLHVDDVKAMRDPDDPRTAPPRGLSREQWEKVKPFVQASAAGLAVARDTFLAFASGEPLVEDGEITMPAVTLQDVRRSWRKALDAMVDFLIRAEALGADVQRALAFARAQLIAIEGVLDYEPEA